MKSISVNSEKMYSMQTGFSFAKARQYRMRLAWSVWMVAALFVLFQFFLQLSSGEIISGLMKSFSLTAFGGGVLASSYYYIYVLLQVPAGMLLDRFGPRGILSLGAAFVCIGCLVFSVAKSMAMALAGRILMGGGSAFAFVGCLNIISIWFPAKRFALMAALVEAAGMCGAIVGNFWIAEAIHRMGWRICMEASGIFSGALTFLLFFIIRNAPRAKKILSSRVMPSAPLFAGLKKIVKNKIVWINGIYSGLLFSIVTTFTALWAIPFLRVSHHINLLHASLVDMALYVGVAIGGPIIGWVDSKTHWRRKLLLINALIGALCLFAVVFFVNFSLMADALLLFLAGICASNYVLTFAIVNETIDYARATAIGFTNMLCVLFSPILQPLVGFFVTWLNRDHGLTAGLNQSIPDFQWAVSIIPLLLIIASGLAFFLPERKI